MAERSPRFFGRASVPQHLRVSWGPWTALLVFVLIWIGLPIAIILVVRELAPYASFMQSFLDGLRSSNVTATFIEDVIDAVGGFALIGFILRRKGVTLTSVGWRKFNVWQTVLLFIGVFLVFTVGVAILLAVVTYLVPGFNENQAQTNEFTGSVALQHPVIAILALVIIPPIIEETTFRGFIFPAFSKRFGVLFGAISSSVLFGFAHLQANVSVYTWLLGMLLCFLYVRTKSIFPGMALHMLNNLLATLAIFNTK